MEALWKSYYCIQNNWLCLLKYPWLEVMFDKRKMHIYLIYIFQRNFRNSQCEIQYTFWHFLILKSFWTEKFVFKKKKQLMKCWVEKSTYASKEGKMNHKTSGVFSIDKSITGQKTKMCGRSDEDIIFSVLNWDVYFLKFSR